jgi:hypothetical protein
MVGTMESIDLLSLGSGYDHGIDLAASNSLYGFLCFFEARSQLLEFGG